MLAFLLLFVAAFCTAVAASTTTETGSSGNIVRFRISQLLGKLLHALPDDAELEETLCDRLQAAMLQRMVDKIPAVREKAAAALTRLQDPAAADCPVTAIFVDRLAHDSSPDVRRAVLSQLEATPATLPAMLERVLDKAAGVHKQLFATLATGHGRSL